MSYLYFYNFCIYNVIFVNSTYLLIHAYAAPDAFSGCDIEVAGGTFTECRCLENGGFLYARPGASVKITGGNIVNNVAVKRGAGVSQTLLYKSLNSNVYSVREKHCSYSRV